MIYYYFRSLSFSHAVCLRMNIELNNMQIDAKFLMHISNSNFLILWHFCQARVELRSFALRN